MKTRTLEILIALIEEFVNTAAPISSQKLLKNHNLKISSATIRTEFVKLEEVGMIASPHVSSGKVPTKKGYRFFIDQITDTQQETDIVTSIFDQHIQKYRFEKSKESLFDVVRIVSQISENVAFASINDDQTFYLGLSNVLRCPEFSLDPEKAAQIVEVLEGKEKFLTLLKGLELEQNQVKIFVGEDHLLEEFSSCAMLVVSFSTNDISGFLGILGPMRMRYSFNKSVLQNAIKML